MSSAKLSVAERMEAQVRELTRRSMLRLVIGMAVINLALLLLFGDGFVRWLFLLLVELAVLGVNGWRAKKAAREALTPLEDEMMEAKTELKASALQAHDLQRLAKKLEKVEEPGLAQRLAVIGSDGEMSVLLEALNDMLDRIDIRYQAQMRFTGDASHELRSPINVILNYAKRLDRKGRDNPEIMDDCIATILEAAEEMTQLIDDLLLLARCDSKSQRMVFRNEDLSSLVDSLARQHQMVDGGRTVIAEVQPDVVAAADAGYLRRCLRVLTENAQKYTPEGGEIRLSLRTEEGRALITVADTGVGIAEKDLPHVFERFYRADESRSRNTGGSGLGLAIAKTIAEQHGGTLTVASKVGEGTAFTLSIPLERTEH